MVFGLNYIRIGASISGQELADMATFTAPGNSSMVYRRSWKTGGCVTDTAIIQCRDMINRLAGGEAASMAGRATVGGCRVVKNYSREAGKVVGVMTIGAIPGGRNVGGVGLGILIDCHNTIVAQRAVVDIYAQVVKRCSREGTARGVACNTIQRGQKVADRWFAGRHNTIVAGIASYTHTHNGRVGVIDKRIDKFGSVMAQRAILRRGWWC